MLKMMQRAPTNKDKFPAAALPGMLKYKEPPRTKKRI